MNRSGYQDDDDIWAIIRWRGCVQSAIRGRRGQRLLRELAEAMDAMPNKRLIAGALTRSGDYCALGVVGAARGIPLDHLDPEESEHVAKALDIADALAREIAYQNDEGVLHYWDETPEARWRRMRAWVQDQLQNAEVSP
jgi:hypothetical protein